MKLCFDLPAVELNFFMRRLPRRRITASATVISAILYVCESLMNMMTSSGRQMWSVAMRTAVIPAVTPRDDRLLLEVNSLMTSCREESGGGDGEERNIGGREKEDG